MRKAVLAVTLNSGLSSNSSRESNKLQVTGYRFRDKYPLLVISCSLQAILAMILFISSPVMGAAPVIEKIEIEGLYSINKEELMYLLDLKTGDAINPADIRNGIKRAFLKGIFEDIQVVAADNGGPLLKIIVREKDFIKSISITGNSYLPDRVIKKHFLLKEDQVMRYDLLDEARKRLKDDLTKRGLPDAIVNVSVNKASKPYGVTLDVQIEEGKPLIISKIATYTGHEGDARELIDTKEGDIYDQFALMDDVEKIRKRYRALGYLNPDASFGFSDGRLELSVKEGRRLSVIFEGNTVFSSKTLMKEMPFFEAGDLRDDLIEEASSRILSLYHMEGYPFAQVATVRSDDSGKSGDNIEMHFYIYEGKTVSVGRIEFSSVTFPEKNLRDIMSLKENRVYNPDVLPQDMYLLKEFYNALGYLGASVQKPDVNMAGSVANIRINIKEGIQSVIDAVEIRGLRSVTEDEARKATGLKRGAPYNEVDISDARYRIIEIYLERGFVDVDVDVRREFNEKDAKIIFEIKEGPQTFFGKTIITGNSRTKGEVVRRELSHRESAPFNYNILVNERHRLYKLGLFNDVNIEPLDKYDGRRDVRVNVAEGDAGAVEFGAGYGDYEKYRGFFDVSYRNLFGMNRQASLRIELSSLEKRLIVNYYEPWFLSRPVPFRTQLLSEERTEKNIDTGEISYRLKRHTLTAGVEKRMSSVFKGELYYEFSIVKTYDVKPDVILSKEDTGTLAISAVRPGIIYDTRDNPFDPKSGILAGLTMEVASGLLFSETDFAKAVFNANFYRELSKTFVLAVSFRGGVAQGFAATRELPLVERFFLGGRSTVRGYAQDTLGPKGSDGTPTGGNAFLMTNIELRSYLGWGLGLVTFIDGGDVWVKTDDMNLSFKYTAGLGLRYNTPVGPLRVDYGYKLMREAGESSGEIHFSIGHAF